MFCDRLRSVRIFRKKTLQTTANEIGVTLRHYQKFESGEVSPDIDRLVKLADFFDVPVDFLLGRDDYLLKIGVSVDVPREGPPRHPKPRISRKYHRIQSSDNGEV